MKPCKAIVGKGCTWMFNTQVLLANSQGLLIVRLSLCVIPVQEEIVGLITQAVRHIGMPCAQCLLMNCERSGDQRLGFAISSFNMINLGQIIRNDCHMGMVLS